MPAGKANLLWLAKITSSFSPEIETTQCMAILQKGVLSKFTGGYNLHYKNLYYVAFKFTGILLFACCK